MANTISIGFSSCDPKHIIFPYSYAVPIVESPANLPPVSVGTIRPYIVTKPWNSPSNGLKEAGLYVQGPAIPNNPLSAVGDFYLLNINDTLSNVDALGKSTIVWYAYLNGLNYSNYPQAHLLGFTYIANNAVVSPYPQTTSPAMLAFAGISSNIAFLS